MNALENIGLERLIRELEHAMDNLAPSEIDRQEFLRLSTLSSVKRALEIGRALQDNHADKTK